MITGYMCFFLITVFSGYMPSSGIAGSYGSFILGFARNLHTILHSGCINLHSTNTARGFPFYISSLVVIVGRRRGWDVSRE